MKREMNPVGQWYLRPDTQELFQVVDWDDFFWNPADRDV